jgi:hypothetical protein
MRKKPINITLPEKLIQDIKIQAVLENRTFSEIVTEQLAVYLVKAKKEKAKVKGKSKN